MLSPEQIIETVRRNPRVPAPSGTVYKILELSKNPNCDFDRVADVISRDSGLTAQLLRQANSALYGFKSPTSSVSSACVRLGLKRVRAAVIDQHVVSGLGRALPPGFDARQYWQGTFATSVAARDLCEAILPASADDACTAGLLCDIGMGLMAFGVPEVYRSVLDRTARSPDVELHEVEQSRLGITHAEVGATILADWGLEAPVIDAVRWHHFDPMVPDDVQPSAIARVVAASVTLSRIARKGSDMDSVTILFAQVDALTPDADALVTRLLDQLVQRIQDTAQSFAVELGPVEQMQENFGALLRGLPDVSERMTCRAMRTETTGA